MAEDPGQIPGLGYGHLLLLGLVSVVQVHLQPVEPLWSLYVPVQVVCRRIHPLAVL